MLIYSEYVWVINLKLKIGKNSKYFIYDFFTKTCTVMDKFLRNGFYTES